MGEVVGVHLKQRPPLKNESGKRNFGQVHSNLDLRYQMANHGAIVLHANHCKKNLWWENQLMSDSIELTVLLLIVLVEGWKVASDTALVGGVIEVWRRV